VFFKPPTWYLPTWPIRLLIFQWSWIVVRLIPVKQNPILLGASFLCQQGHLMYKSNMSPTRNPRASPRAHIRSNITHPDPLLNQSYATLRDANNQCKDSSGATQNSVFPPKPATPALLTARQHDPAIRDSSYTARSSPILNVISHLFKCELLWIEADISAWRA